jgi:hypothetical protein
MISQPLAGTRHVGVTDRRTALDFGGRLISDDLCEDAEKVILVMDDLNTHKLSSLDQAFEPKEARRLWEWFEVHHTPKHGSSLNTAEIKLSVLSRQCLDRRFEHREALSEAVDAWLIERNERGVPVNWRFTTKETASSSNTFTHRSPSG